MTENKKGIIPLKPEPSPLKSVQGSYDPEKDKKKKNDLGEG